MCLIFLPAVFLVWIVGARSGLWGEMGDNDSASSTVKRRLVSAHLLVRERMYFYEMPMIRMRAAVVVVVVRSFFCVIGKMARREPQAKSK